MELSDISSLERQVYVARWERRTDDQARLQARLDQARDTYLLANAYQRPATGAWLWRSSSNVVPEEFLALRPQHEQDITNEARRDGLRLLREQMLVQDPPGGEELAEMRAAFGTGTSVVNVLTGRVTRL